MARSLRATLSACALSAATLCAFSFTVSGQTPMEIETLANRTAERVIKTHRQHFLVAGLYGCQLETEMCTLFEASLDAKLEKMVADVRFAKRENVVNILEGRAFIALDAYFSQVLEAAAINAGADILVTDNLEWQNDGYELTSEVFDAVQQKKLDQFRIKIRRSMPDSGGEPFVFKDLESGISFIIPRGKQSGHSVIDRAECIKCPDPSYTPEARAHRLEGRVVLLATITEQGVAEQIGVLDALKDGLTNQAVEAVRNWRLKPAIGKDGKPMATRVPIEVTFRLI